MLLPGKVAEGLGESAAVVNQFSQQRVVSQCPCNGHINIQKGFCSRPFQTPILMALSHGVPKVWLAFQLLMFSCPKPKN